MGVAHFLALKRNTALLLIILVLAGTGEKLWLGFAPKYIEWLGGGVLVIGLSCPCRKARRLQFLFRP